MLLTSAVVDAATFAEETGWTLKPQGACKGEHCVPLPPQALTSQGAVNVPVVAERLGLALVVDDARGITAVGPESAVTGRMLTTAEAPDLELPTFTGEMFRLSSLRGKRVLLVAWASWCGCAHDLPVWQEVYERVRPLGLEIVTVAMDALGADAGREFIERAQPTHAALVDATHAVGRLFGVTNVPTGIWIDENGMIVRPAEPAFPGRVVVFEELKRADLRREQEQAGGELNLMHQILKSDRAGLSPEVTARLELTRRIADAAEPGLYLEMVLDWAANGAGSEYVLPSAEVIERSAPRSPDGSAAAAHFELGRHLQLAGDHDGAVTHWREAHRLQPLNWTYKRQAWRFEYGPDGDPSRYEGSMEKDLADVGPENYYPKLQPKSYS
jgi:peroxiredoxin